MEVFNKCIPIILKHEGGYVDDPDDLGGETNFGICKKSYPDLDIKNLTIDQAKKIYYEDYWFPMRLYNITNDELVLHVFDHGINAGIRTSLKMLQRVVGVDQDGYIGNQTLKAISNFNGDIVQAFKNARIQYYNDIVAHRPANAKFLKGWLHRIETCKFE